MDREPLRAPAGVRLEPAAPGIWGAGPRTAQLAGLSERLNASPAVQRLARHAALLNLRGSIHGRAAAQALPSAATAGAGIVQRVKGTSDKSEIDVPLDALSPNEALAILSSQPVVVAGQSFKFKPTGAEYAALVAKADLAEPDAGGGASSSSSAATPGGAPALVPLSAASSSSSAATPGGAASHVPASAASSSSSALGGPAGDLRKEKLARYLSAGILAHMAGEERDSGKLAGGHLKVEVQRKFPEATFTGTESDTVAWKGVWTIPNKNKTSKKPGPSKKSTFFPQSWDVARLKKEIENAVEIGPGWIRLKGDIFVDTKGDTFFPIVEG